MARVASLVVSCLALGFAVAGQDASSPVVGSEFQHVVGQGDTWQGLGARFGVEPATLATINHRGIATRLTPGDVLRVDNRHLVPGGGPASGVVINLPQRMLFVKDTGRVLASYPVGLGRPDWPTFTGQFTIVTMETDPVWDVPKSIQEELRRAGKTVVTRVGPGPANPLGKFWLGLSAAAYGIHGTIATLSIYRFQSHGCIRLHPDDIADLWTRVAVGMPGEIVYEPVLLGVTSGDIVLEAHSDIYRRRVGDAEAVVWSAAKALGVAEQIDWAVVAELLKQRDGHPQSVARTATFVGKPSPVRKNPQSDAGHGRGHSQTTRIRRELVIQRWSAN